MTQLVQDFPQSPNSPYPQGRLTTDSVRPGLSGVRRIPASAVLEILQPNLIEACAKRVNPQKAPRLTRSCNSRLRGSDSGSVATALMSGETLVAVSCPG
jgi:hypothetical protein